MDHEPGADQLFSKVDLGVLQERQRHRVDQDTRAVAFEDKVILFRGIGQADVVLKARAAAAFHGHTQALGGIRCGVDLVQSGESAVGDFWWQVELHLFHCLVMG